MGFRHPGFRVWDFWLANDQWATTDPVEHHLFYLMADAGNPDPDSRHQRARIGHAVSDDLVNWETRPRVLSEPLHGSPDDRATWTGCTIRDQDGLWHMFYTGVSAIENGQVQRILSATSTDLVHWNRSELCLEADPAWYEKWTPDLPEEHWRDPWVHWLPELGQWHMYITARSGSGPSDGRGVVALATSPDLDTWTVHPPVTSPGDLRQLEVPQLVPLRDGWGLLFCHGPDDFSAARLADPGTQREGGLHLYFAEKPTGPFESNTDLFFHRGTPPRLYGGRLHRHGGQTWLLASLTVDHRGNFVGGVSDPYQVVALQRGKIELAPSLP